MWNKKKMNSILFIVPTPANPENYINSLPPMGVLSMATLLKSKNVKAAVTDRNIESLDKHNIADFDVIGFSVMISNIENTMKIAEKVKKDFPEKTVMVGGPHVNSNPNFFIRKSFIDIVCVGEGELTVLELMSSKNPEKVKGLLLKGENGKVVFTGTRERIRDLDSLPFPDLGMVDYKKYDVPMKKKKPISDIMTSRGCPFGCTFCFRSLGKLWVARSPENVVDEIELQVKKFGIKEICIFDDNFTLDVKRAERICDLIIERGIKTRFQLTNGIRVDKADRNLLEKFKKIGLWMVDVAPESGNPETLKKVKKGFDLKKVFDVVKWCHELGLSTHSHFMVGFPWEKKEDIEHTIEFAIKLDADITRFSRVVPLPGTELFEQMGFDLDRDFDKDKGLFYGGVGHKIEGISDEEIHSLIKKGYRRFFLRPKKILKLMKTFSIVDLLKLFKYSITSESII